jgi:chromate transporter
MTLSKTDRRGRLKELALLFLKLGTIAFGGPAAHIAMMRDEVVEKRKWMTDEEFLDLNSAASLIPGPNSTELAIHIGNVRAGWPGLIVAGVCFIVPAMVIVLGLAWIYVTYGQLPQVGAILYGIQPVVIAIILQALWLLSKNAVKNVWLGLLCFAALILTLTGINELVILFGAGLMVSLVMLIRNARKKNSTAAILPLMLFQAGGASAGTATLTSIFLFFLKVGAVLFGSGYVLIAFLRADLVEQYQWLTDQQLLDAVTVGQITPGPVFTTATFIGYLLAGVPGAVVATVGIFLPAFVFVALSAWLVPRMRKSKVFGGFLDGVNVASIALIAWVMVGLGRSAIVDIPTILLFVVSSVLLIRFKINSGWLILGGAVIGLLILMFQTFVP